MVKSHILKLAAVAAMSLPLVAQAGTVVKASGKESKAVVEEVKKSCITGDLGVNFVSEYISRGVVFENQGVIAQPYLNLYFSLYEGEGFINAVNLNLGLWSSLHSHKTGNDSSTSAWFEFDYSAGVAVTFAKNFTLNTRYLELTSPADYFNTSRNIELTLSYDDSDLLGAFALRPHATVLFEIDGHAGASTQEGGADGIYYELGIAPSVALIKDGSFPVTLTVPVNVGFGNNSFYEDGEFGYVSAGVNFAVGLGFVPSCYGTWTLNAGATYYYLDNSKDDDFVGVINDLGGSGEENRVVFSGGIGLAF